MYRTPRQPSIYQFNSFKAPKEIFLAGKDRLTFEYSLLKERSQMVYNTISGTKTTKYYTTDKAYEWAVTSPSSGGGGTTTITAYIDGDPYSASYIQHSTFTGTTKTTEYNRYLHRDYQGTILAITGSDGKLIEQRRFDAWGQIQEVRHYTYGSTGSPTITTDKTLTTLDRGYTGHEHLQSIGLINMNGRLYDPLMRRFLSPDNFIQDPYNTQNYNRYGYVYNNPLVYTDPSGELIFGMAAAVFFSKMLTAAAIGAGIGATMHMINNASQGIPIWWGLGKATAIGAVSGAISFGIGQYATSIFGNGFAVSKALFQAGAHGISGGLINVAGSGNWDTFGSGFASGFVSSMVSSYVGKALKLDGVNPNDYSIEQRVAIIASGGLSGGISSTIAGGNFWDGMRQGLITAGLNHAMSHLMQGDPPGGKKYKFHVMLDSEGAEGAGHQAIAGELDNGKLRYMSLNGTEDKTDANFLGKGWFDDKVFNNLDAIQKYYGSEITPGHHYNKIDTYTMTRSQMNRAFKSAIENGNQYYFLFWNNCANIATESLKDAYMVVYAFRESSIPRWNQSIQRFNFYKHYLHTQYYK